MPQIAMRAGARARSSRTLLLWADFALGDTIQDLRFVSRARAAHPAAGIIVECDRRLVSLIDGGDDGSRGIAGDGDGGGGGGNGGRGSSGVEPPLRSAQPGRSIDAVIAYTAPLPAFDLHLPLRRLQELLGISVDTIPIDDVPYVTIDPARAAYWRARLHHTAARKTRKTRKTVGIIWAGDQTRRDARIKSASLADFAPLARFSRDELRVISLQFGPGVDELIAPPPGLRVERLLDDRCDIADTAALMGALDLVISVDTLSAHLAGALGRPVWVLAAHAPAWWLWHSDREIIAEHGRDAEHLRSRWYPTMRLFRQSRAGDWDSVMQQVCAALRA